MSVPQFVSHFEGCRHRLAELRGRADYLPLCCAILRFEGPKGAPFDDDRPPFAPILGTWPHLFTICYGHDGIFALAFYAAVDGATRDRLAAARAAVESVTCEAQRLLDDMSARCRERLVLPASSHWWRTAFHLAWHFPRPFLRADRQRLLTRDGTDFDRADETTMQLYGSAGRRDLIPGTIYSELGPDIAVASEAAIDAVLDILRACPDPAPLPEPAARPLSPEQRELFRRLRDEFEPGAEMPLDLEGKLLKLASSFETPPASEWAAFRSGGCAERSLTLSRLNEMHELCQVRGPAAEHFLGLAERAGRVLPPELFPDRPILFDNLRRNDLGIQIGFSGPRPVLNRDGAARWLGFVYATLKDHPHPALDIRWLTKLEPLGHALATLDRNLYATSLLAMNLAGLTGPTPPDACRPYTMHESHPLRRVELGGWEILRDAPEDVVSRVPAPATGRLVTALDPPALDGFAESRGEVRLAPRREHLALHWQNGEGREVVRGLAPTGCLLIGYQRDATWLPECWEIDVFPTGWTLPHLEHWFDYAIDVARIEDRNDIPPGSEKSPKYLPTPRGLVTHAHLIVRHLGLPNSPAEPRTTMDRAACLAELRDLLTFFRRALRPAQPDRGHSEDGSMSLISQLLDEATRGYATSEHSFWVVAYPRGLLMRRCEENDPNCGLVVDGHVALPFGGVRGGAIVGVGEHGEYIITALTRPHPKSDEVSRFFDFASRAGAALVASPPAWYAGLRGFDSPALTWVAAVLLLAPAAAHYLTEKPGGCRWITQPWAASLAALRDWQVNAEGPAAAVTSGAPSPAEAGAVDPQSGARVLLRDRDEGPVVLGKAKKKLTVAQYNVVKALLDAPETGLTKDELVSQSGHEDARGILVRLTKKDTDWRKVIRFPRPNGRRIPPPMTPKRLFKIHTFPHLSTPFPTRIRTPTYVKMPVDEQHFLLGGIACPRSLTPAAWPKGCGARRPPS